MNKWQIICPVVAIAVVAIFALGGQSRVELLKQSSASWCISYVKSTARTPAMNPAFKRFQCLPELPADWLCRTADTGAHALLAVVGNGLCASAYTNHHAFLPAPSSNLGSAALSRSA